MIPKFRAWINDGEHSRMVKSDQAVMTAIKNCYGGYGVVEGTTGYHYVDTAARPEKYILMQSTGLKDNNGVEIFEGDVVKITVSNGFDYLEDALSIVKASKYHTGLICKLVSNTLEYRIFADESIGYEYEVIGNIYENPELLEESQ